MPEHNQSEPSVRESKAITVDVTMIHTIGRQVGIPDNELPRFERFVSNALAMRREMMSRLTDTRRSIEDECGYPDTISLLDYQNFFDRDPIAARAVEVMSKEAFQVHPSVYEVEDGDKITPTEQSWKGMIGGLSGRKSWFTDEHGALLWNYLKEADIQSNLGRYSIILLGLNDGKSLDTPAIPKKGMKLLYMRVFQEKFAEIKTLETDEGNARFGQPELYTVQFSDPSTYGPDVYSGVEGITRDVHWTRVIHISRGTIYHIPEMQQIFNNLMALQKLYGGSAEMYWKGAFPGISLESDPRLGGDVDFNPLTMRDMMERYMNGLQRYIALNGFVAKSLAPQVVDPTPQINVHIEAICIRKGIPMRIFKGSERGELSSAQDDSSWNDRVREYQNGHLTPMVIIPFVDRVIWLGIVDEPKESLHVYWPDLDTQTADEKATVALKETQAVVMFASQGGESVMTVFDFLTKILKKTDAEAIQILEGIQEELATLGDEARGSSLLSRADGVNALVNMFKLAQTGGLNEEQLKQTLIMFYGMSDEQADEFLASGLAPNPVPGQNPLLTGTNLPSGNGQSNTLPALPA